MGKHKGSSSSSSTWTADTVCMGSASAWVAGSSSSPHSSNSATACCSASSHSTAPLRPMLDELASARKAAADKAAAAAAAPLLQPAGQLVRMPGAADTDVKQQSVLLPAAVLKHAVAQLSGSSGGAGVGGAAGEWIAAHLHCLHYLTKTRHPHPMAKPQLRCLRAVVQAEASGALCLVRHQQARHAASCAAPAAERASRRCMKPASEQQRFSDRDRLFIFKKASVPSLVASSAAAVSHVRAAVGWSHHPRRRLLCLVLWRSFRPSVHTVQV